MMFLTVSAAAQYIASLFQHRKPVIYAGVEGGGSSWRAAIAVGDPANIQERQTFLTTTPEETLTAIRAWLDQRKFDALGIATFGPIEPSKGQELYGHITSTPKPHWKNANVVGALWDKTVPHMFDTDVNAPAMSEYMAVGKAKGHSSAAYITVGTGVGGTCVSQAESCLQLRCIMCIVGLVVNGKPVHGLLHPEGGHMMLRRDKNDKSGFNGWCKFHDDCVEGMAAAPALAMQLGVDKEQLKDFPDDHPIWESCSHTLAVLCANIILLVSPESIVLSGGVLLRECLFDKIRDKTKDLLQGYVQKEILLERTEELIRPSKWGNNAGIIGALFLARCALENEG
eukprot:TRINITY_DN6113_c0_g1_i2.p1 TRINITY_DN6113_c0_g1~~TRINITY_DN6113_c0_g1_i2.p1  ORF type:complete len:341 (+),score=35.39 TRINITY_DN6113_c0_g1_i2:163-1185(+)